MSDQIISVDATQRAFDSKWEVAEKYLREKVTGKFLGALAFQEIDYDKPDVFLRQIKTLVDQRLTAPKGKVLVQPRGSYTSRTALRLHADLDLDLVFPEDFAIVATSRAGPVVSRNIAQVLGLPDPFANNPGTGHDPSGNLVITKDGLLTVMIYVWGRLVSNDYVLPRYFTTRPLVVPANYTIAVRGDIVPTMKIVDDKTLATLTRSIPAEIPAGAPNLPANDPSPLPIDFFIKVVTTRFGGEEVLVGVDKDGPLGARQYQTTTFIPTGKEWLGGNPLSPIDRTALLALKWWKNSFSDDRTILPFTVRDPPGPNRAGKAEDIKLKSHHFLAALNALHDVPPTDPLYVPTNSSLPFSLVRVMDVMLKVLTYLQRAYQPPQRFTTVYYKDWNPQVIRDNNPWAVYPFPQVSCGAFDTLYKQVATSIVGYDAIINSKVIPTFAARLRAALEALARQNPAFTPTTYTFEEE